MALKCTADGRQEAVGFPIYACHHCGKPVCEQHGWVVPADDAFDDSAEDQGRRTPQAVRSVRRVPQPAMHCKQCVDEQHPRASKHPGWVDPKGAQRTAGQARTVQQQAGVQQGQPWGQPGQQYGPQQGQYPPQQGQYPPQQGQYPPQQGQYPPQQ
jgi:hypothetical protein